jgi:uncharacterized protein YkwD
MRTKFLAFAAIAIACLAVSGPEEAAARTKCPDAHTAPQKLRPKEARESILCLIDEKRAMHGVGLLDADHRLQRAAQRHDDLMDRTGCFAHDCPGEPALETRLKSVGYIDGGVQRWVVAENLAWGIDLHGSPAKIVRAWMHSPEHRSTMLMGELREIGVGFNRGTPSKPHTSGATFTTDFGLRIPARIDTPRRGDDGGGGTVSPTAGHSGSGGRKCVQEQEARPYARGDGPPPQFSDGFYELKLKLDTSVDGIDRRTLELPISIEQICNVPQQFLKEARQLGGADGVAKLDGDTKVVKNKQVLEGEAALRAIDGADTAKVKGYLAQPDEWGSDEDGNKVATFLARKVRITD